MDSDKALTATFVQELALEGIQAWVWSNDTKIIDSAVCDVDGDGKS